MDGSHTSAYGELILASLLDFINFRVQRATPPKSEDSELHDGMNGVPLIRSLSTSLLSSLLPAVLSALGKTEQK
jgi:hypothetical protein